MEGVIEIAQAHRALPSAILNRLEQKFQAQFDDRNFDIYIPPRGGLVRESPETFPLVEKLHAFVSGTEYDSLLLLGDPGQGKTLLSLWLARYYWQHPEATDAWLPVWIWLPSIPESDRSQRLLETHLAQQGLLKSEIQAIQAACQNKQLRLLILLDGLDEIAVDETNLYLTNGWWGEAWPQVKVAAFCRPEAFAYHTDRLNYQRLFYSQSYETPDAHTRFIELYLQPFAPADIETYLQMYVKQRAESTPIPHSTLPHHSSNSLEAVDEEKADVETASSLHASQQDWSDWQTYQHYLQTIHPLAALAQNPFVLSILVQALPRIVAEVREELKAQSSSAEGMATSQQHLYTRERVYRVFVQDWLERQATRLLQDPEKHKVLVDLGRDAKTLKTRLLACLFTYAENLARLALNVGGGKLDAILTEEMTLQATLLTPAPDAPPYFLSESAAAEALPLIRSGCLLKYQGTTYRFLHKTIVEYLAARALFNSAHVAAEAYVRGIQLEQVNELFSFNKQLLLKEPQIIQLLADLVSTKPDFKELLYQTVELSREEPLLAVAAANAMTILNVAGEAFTGKDFRGIQIPGADLTGAICDHTDFTGANLQGVHFEHAWLAGAQLTGANLTDVHLGELPSFQHDAIIMSCLLDPQERWLLLLDLKGRISQCDIRNGKKLKQWEVPASGALAKLQKGSSPGREELNRISADGRWVHVVGLKTDGLDEFTGHYLLNTTSGKLMQPAWLQMLSPSTSDEHLTLHFTELQGKTLAVGHIRQKMSVYEVETERCLRTFLLPATVNQWVVSANSRRLAVVQGNEVRFYKLASFLINPDLPVTSFPSGLTWSAEMDSIRLGLTANNQLVVGLMKKDTRQLELFIFKEFGEFSEPGHLKFTLDLSGSKGAFRHYFLHPLGELMLIPADQALEVWHIESGKHLLTVPLPSSMMEWMFAHNISDILQFSSLTPQFHISMDTYLYRCFLSTKAHRFYPRYAALPFEAVNVGEVENGTWVTSVAGENIRLDLDIDEETGQGTLEGKIGYKLLFSLHFKVGTPAGLFERAFAKLDDIETADNRDILLALSPNERYAAFSYSFEAGSAFGALKAISNSVYSIGKALMPLGSDTTIRIWDLQTQRLLHQLSSYNNIFTLFFSADSTWLITVGLSLKVWDLRSGRCLYECDQHYGGVACAALSANKQWLALVDSAGHLELWSLQPQQRVVRLHALPLRLRKLAFSLDNQLLRGKTDARETVLFALYFLPGSPTPQLRLLQRSTLSNLYAQGADVSQAYGLSPDFQLLLQQRDVKGQWALSPPATEVQDTRPDISLTPDMPVIQQGLSFPRPVIDRHTFSQLYDRYPLDYQNWVIAFVRDIKSQKNDAHTFILMEGMNAYGRLILYRYDLATKIGQEKVQDGFAKVKIETRTNVPLDRHQARLNDLINPEERKNRGIESVVGFAWSVTRAQALLLDDEIRADEAKGLIKYHVLGDTTLASRDGHNCYTWAREKLIRLRNPKITQDLPKSFLDHFGAHPKLHLNLTLDKEPTPTSERPCKIM